MLKFNLSKHPGPFKVLFSIGKLRYKKTFDPKYQYILKYGCAKKYAFQKKKFGGGNPDLTWFITTKRTFCKVNHPQDLNIE